MNPLLWLDLRLRVRERRLWVIAGFFVLMLAAIAGLATAIAWRTTPGQAGQDPGGIGSTLGWTTLFCQAGLLMILAPLASACRLSQEREQRTLAALINSPMPAGRIAAGKLWGAWTFTFWLAALALPFLAVADVWGGISSVTLWLGFALNLAMGLTMATIALGLSGLFGRSLTAYLVTGALLFFWAGALPLIGALVMGLIGGHNPEGAAGMVGFVFWYHTPVFPLIRLMMGEAGEHIPGGWWTLPYALAVWTLLAFGGYRLAVRGLKREVY